MKFKIFFLIFKVKKNSNYFYTIFEQIIKKNFKQIFNKLNKYF